MSKPKYRIREAALTDLKGIWKFTSKKWSRSKADDYIKKILEEIGVLAQNPNSGRPIFYIREGYWIQPVASHVLIFRVENGTIEIMRVFHQRMDLITRIKKI